MDSVNKRWPTMGRGPTDGALIKPVSVHLEIFPKVHLDQSLAPPTDVQDGGGKGRRLTYGQSI